MLTFLKKRPHLLSLAICFIASQVGAQSGPQFNAQDFNTRSVFELVVNDSSVLKAGASKIMTQSAFVTLAHGLIPGNSEGLEIQFFKKPITDQTISSMARD